MRQFKKSGEITVFLSLLFLVICAFLGALLKSAKSSFVRNKIEATTDISIKSSFAEYNKMLFEKYHLLFVDTTYKGVVDGGSECFKEHFTRYFDLNLSGEENRSYGLSFMSADVSDAVFAVENMYEPVVIQIQKYLYSADETEQNRSDKEALINYVEDVIGADKLTEYVLASNKYSGYTSDDLYEAEDENQYGYDEEFWFDKFCEAVSEDDLLEIIIDYITDDMRESYGHYFDFSKHLYSAHIKVYVNSSDGKTYECTK